MAFESIPEIVAGVAVEVVMFAIFAGVIYRFFSGRFVIPKREIVLPNQRGVIVEGERIVRVAEPGIAGCDRNNASFSATCEAGPCNWLAWK
jgi:hypothetical protein